MKPPLVSVQSWQGRRVRIVALRPNQREQRIHDAIARRAYGLFEARRKNPAAQPPASALDDWRRAESEIVRPLSCGFLILDDRVALTADVFTFAEDAVEVLPEPLRLTICGSEYFSVLDLPVAIDPLHVVAQLNGRILKLELFRPAPATPLRQAA